MADPLSDFTTNLQQFLVDSPAIKRVMKSNVEKRIEAFVSTRSTKVNDVMTESDLPRIYLLPQGGPSNVNLASNLATFQLDYEVGIRSGDKRFSFDLFPLTFALFAACTRAVRDAELFALTWEGYRFVRNMSLSNISTGFISTTGDAQGISGTNAVCTLTAYLDFPQTLLVAHDQT